MRKGQKKWKNDIACTLHYKGETRKCFAQDFKDLRYKGYQAIKRAFKLNCNMNIDDIQQISHNEWHGETISTCGKRISYVIINRRDRIKEAARLLGQIGGQAGTGKKKVRGDSNYYRLLRLKGVEKKQQKIRNNIKKS